MKGQQNLEKRKEKKADFFSYDSVLGSNLTNFHSRYLQQRPGPSDGLKEEGHDQQHQCHPDHLDARAARIEPCYFLIRFQAVCGKSFAERVLRKEFAERVKLAAD